MLMSLPLVAFSQKQYYLKTFDDTFSSDPLGWYGDPFSDFTITLDTANGILDVVVKKEDPWSVFDKYMGNCWANSLVLDQSNRYMEFRVKSVGAAVTKPITVYPKWGRNDGCPAENKTYPNMNFTIPVADEWKIVFLTIPQSTGGSQNVIDTLTWRFAMELPNGRYQFDYIKLGNAAIPPTPTIDVVKDKSVLENAGPQTVTLTGISLPGRDFIDGLDITAEAKSRDIITDVTILDPGNGKIHYDEATKKGTATLSFTPVNGKAGNSDSIIITLLDTIRWKMVRTGFKVTLLEDFSRKQYLKSFDATFSFDDGGWYGDSASDFTITLDTANGILDVVVKKSNWFSMFAKNMGNCNIPSLVLDQTNRYVELRVKSVGKAVTNPVRIYPNWGGIVGCDAEVKTYANMSFTIPVADEWKIVFLTIPQSTGGSQNVIDTLTRSFAIELPNGTYQFDYIKLGNAAASPIPTMDVVKDKNIPENAGPQTVTLTGISILGRDFIDGLDITAEAKAEGILTDVTILDPGNGKIHYDQVTKKGTATLSFTPVIGANGLSDSVIITLRDTIRGKMVRKGFKVTLVKAQIALSDADDNVKVYPTEVSDVVNIELAEAVTGEVSVVDVVGNVVASQKLVAASTAKVDLSNAAAGMYLVKIAKGSEVVVRKVVKK